MHRVLQPHPAHGLCLQGGLQAQLGVYSDQGVQHTLRCVLDTLEKLEAPGPLRRSISADPHKYCLPIAPPVAGIDSLLLGPLNTSSCPKSIATSCQCSYF